MWRYLIALTIAYFFVILTLVLPTYVSKATDLKGVSFGYPLRFATQDYSEIDPKFLPAQISFSTKKITIDASNKTTVNKISLLLDILIVYAVIELILFGGKKLTKGNK